MTIYHNSPSFSQLNEVLVDNTSEHQIVPACDDYRFIQVMLSCNTVAIVTHTKYGTCATATHL